VKKHGFKSDLWIILHNKVYDVTRFLDEHPGGVDILIDNAGLDATHNFEDVGHSDDALKLAETFCIGELSTASAATTMSKTRIRPYEATTTTTTTSSSSSTTSRPSNWKEEENWRRTTTTTSIGKKKSDDGSLLSYWYFLVPIIAAAFISYKYYKSSKP